MCGRTEILVLTDKQGESEMLNTCGPSFKREWGRLTCFCPKAGDWCSYYLGNLCNFCVAKTPLDPPTDPYSVLLNLQILSL